MNRLIAVTLCVSFLCAWVGAAAQSRPAFEVVSIKPASPPAPEAIRSGTFRIAFDVDGARVRISGYTLFLLLTAAFRVEPPQVAAPDFARDAYFEIQATLPEGATREQVPEMLQTMLAERFGLAYHRETREYPISVLTVGKSGMKLPRLPDHTRMPPTSERLADGTTRMTQTGRIASLLPVMKSFGGLQLVDETGLDGTYTWVRDLPPLAPGMTFQDAMQESFKAMIEAAGLKLETRKIPKETIVVDHLEKTPTEN